MSFLSERSPSELLGGMVAAIIGGLLVRFLLAGGVEEYFNPDKRIENQIVAALEQHPADLAVLRAIERYFPQDYEDLLGRMTDAASGGATGDAVGAEGAAEIAAFMDAHQNDFAFAPAAALDDVLARETAAIEALAAQDPSACAGFAHNPHDPLARLDPQAQALVGDVMAARVQAMAAGRADQHMRLDVTPDDLANIAARMRAAGAHAAQMELIFDGIGRTELSVDAQCDGALRLLRAIAGEAETEQRALLIGELLAVREVQPG